VASVRLLRRAEADLEEAVAWYEARSPQTARRFEGAANAVGRIAAMPEMYARTDERHRVCPIRRSQYLIVYRYEPMNDEAIIVAVAHVSQDPPVWQSRA
jgi:plasmid stabilization system protein ParE